ncbi:MAG: hydrogenase iron-sulfur subunit [Candidatus Bathyarchaeota archaeon]|jgi:coenzyme F420-reducing hydrogenase delta subunit|nr:hydrogenase iron-sulfur subunit [Candidatus Bathyarchaeota archaeon]
MAEFEPKIIGFLCNWCSYAGADLAGVSRIQYPPNIRVIRVMCSGRVDPVIVLEMFINGADGVIVMGCHPGDCHYMEGNLHEERKIKMLKMLLALTGLETERLRLEWVSAAEGQRFAQIVTDFTEQIRKLGPSPVSGEKPNWEISENLRAAKDAASDSRLRVLVGREREITEKSNVYKEKIPQEQIDSLLRETVEAEFIRRKIRLLTKDKPLSVKDLARVTNVKPADILSHIVNMRRRGMITVDHIEETTPFYKALGGY